MIVLVLVLALDGEINVITYLRDLAIKPCVYSEHTHRKKMKNFALCGTVKTSDKVPNDKETMLDELYKGPQRVCPEYSARRAHYVGQHEGGLLRVWVWSCWPEGDPIGTEST